MARKEMSFGRAMTDAEAMMWAIERDPWLSPSGGSITLFDRPLDVDRFRRLMTNAAAGIPRLRQRVVDAPAPLVNPHWEVDRELDLDWHVRRMRAPGTGSLRDLLDWVVLWLQDPYDRTRPLWQYVVIDDVEGGLGALAMKLHHVVTDGKGAVKLAGIYTDLERDAPEPDPVDLDALLAAEPDDRAGMSEVVGGAMRLPLAAGRAVLDTLTHPGRLAGAGQEVENLVRTASEQQVPAGSTLWTSRSRRRHGEAVSLPFEQAREVWKALDGTLNDFFMTAVVEAAARYHRANGAHVDHFHLTFVVAVPKAAGSNENAFSPIPLDVPADAPDVAARFAVVRDLLHDHRERVHGSGPLAAVATVANLMPTPWVTNVARSQAAHVDMATSNLPGYLGDSFVAGAQTLHTYIFGPVAGTACNITLYTTAGSIDVGIHVDPAAVADPPLLRQCLEEAFADLVAVVAPPAASRRRRTPPKR
jgi:WS/DGAT/MGAT family acyltransferase